MSDSGLSLPTGSVSEAEMRRLQNESRLALARWRAAKRNVALLDAYSAAYDAFKAAQRANLGSAE